jgi:hypothetical protein
MSPIILFLRVFGKKDATQTTGEFKTECGDLTKDATFVGEVETFGKAAGIIPQTEVISLTS